VTTSVTDQAMSANARPSFKFSLRHGGHDALMTIGIRCGHLSISQRLEKKSLLLCHTAALPMPLTVAVAQSLLFSTTPPIMLEGEGDTLGIL